MEIVSQIFQFEIFGNSFLQISFSAAAFAFLIYALPRGKKEFIARFKKFSQKTKTQIDDLILQIFKKTNRLFFFFVALFGAAYFLNLPPEIYKIFKIVILAVFLWQITRTAILLANFGFEKIAEKDAESGGAIRFLGRFANFGIYTISVLFFLQNLGINVSSFVAGLGISGIAVALAAQNILSDMFASLSIFFDKPFAAGDFVSFAGIDGTIEKIGIKTTRIRALSGEEIIVANKKLTETEIKNFAKIIRRRGRFQIGVEYSTSQEKLKKIPEIVKSLGAEISNCEIDRVVFFEFGDFSLNFEIVFFAKVSSFGEFRKVQNDLNFKIFEKFASEKIAFAFPTQSIFVEKMPPPISAEK